MKKEDVVKALYNKIDKARFEWEIKVYESHLQYWEDHTDLIEKHKSDIKGQCQ